MAEQRRGLGRGLSALLEEIAPGADGEGAAPSVGSAQAAPIELIRRNPDQPRRHFDEAEIAGLADSIREKGVLQPILVRPAPGAPGEFQIVAGERRWRAAQAAGLSAVPIVVRDLDDGETLEIAILENVQRADLNPIEEAAGYRALMERFGRTQDVVAQAVGKSRSHVANSIRLLSLPTEVRAMLEDGRLTAGHARAIASAPDPLALARQAVDRGLNVREVENLARKGAGNPPRAPRRPTSGKDADTLGMEHELSEALGLSVDLSFENGAGELRIRYETLEQLDGLLRRLMRS